MGRRNQYSASDFIKAIPGSGGIISTIAKRVGCEWMTVKRALDSMPTVKEAYDSESETVLDMAESVLLKNIKEGDSADAKWYLSRKGKGRGYVERTESTNHTIDLRTLTDEQLDRLDAGESIEQVLKRDRTSA